MTTIVHGKYTTYANRKCRCDACSAANRAYARKRFYGLSDSEYALLMAKQGGGCAICHTPLIDGGKMGLHVDHNHETGKTRGLLCGKCNLAIGYMQENPATLRAAAEYVEAYEN